MAGKARHKAVWRATAFGGVERQRRHGQSRTGVVGSGDKKHG